MKSTRRGPEPWAIAAMLSIWLLNVVACSSGPTVRSYVLTVPAAATAVNSGSSASPSAPARLLVRRVLVPDYLDTTDITLRRGPNEVKASTTGRWGERLSEGLTDALAADLSARLPQAGAQDFVTGQVLITVEALDLWSDGRCVLAASWRIVDPDNPALLITGRETFATSASAARLESDDANLVAAVALTVGRLADSIATSVRATP